MGKSIMARATLTLELDTLDDVHTITLVLKDRLEATSRTVEYLEMQKADPDSEVKFNKSAEERLEGYYDEITSLQRILSIVGDDGRADRLAPAEQEESGS